MCSSAPSIPHTHTHKDKGGLTKDSSTIQTLPFPFFLSISSVRRLCGCLCGASPLPPYHPLSSTISLNHNSFIFQFCKTLCTHRKETALGETACSQPFSPSLLKPKEGCMRAWQSDLRSTSTPICHCPHASGICEATSHQHITNGARAPRAPCLPRMIYGPCQSSRLNCRDSWSVQQREQQSITAQWSSPRNPSRASSWWHLCRGRKRSKGKRWREWTKSGKFTQDFSELQSHRS